MRTRRPWSEKKRLVRSHCGRAAVVSQRWPWRVRQAKKNAADAKKSTRRFIHEFLFLDFFCFLDFIFDGRDVPTFARRILTTGSAEMHVSNSTGSI